MFLVDQDRDDVFELYSRTVGDKQPRKLGGALVTGGVALNSALVVVGDVFVVSSDPYRHVRIAPDGSRVVYVADQEVDERFELYSVPLDGSASPVALNGALVSGGDLATSLERCLQISPDSNFVVYVADQRVEELSELFLAPVDGGLEPSKLNWPLAQSGVAAFEITPDSGRVVFQATERSQVTELSRAS